MDIYLQVPRDSFTVVGPMYNIRSLRAVGDGVRGRGAGRDPWWRQTTEKYELRSTLKDISADVLEQRRREYSRYGGRGDHKGGDNCE